MIEADRVLFERARAAAAHAYAPYSNFLVGAAVRARDGQVYVGVNVENAAYPLGICAERSAIAQAVADGIKPGDLEAIAITAAPCGGCRQWLVEFKLERVVYLDNEEELISAGPEDLLPGSFVL